MSFIPHTAKDITDMLAEINIHSIEELFDEIPQQLHLAKLNAIPASLNELEIKRLMLERAPHYIPGCNYMGAGVYEHHIPAAIWDLVGRGEFYTAYTPYQAEASQGSLQLLYEYQSMMAHLMGMDVSNASLYDGSTALAEAVLMAVRIKQPKGNRVIIPSNIHPHYRRALRTLVAGKNILLEEQPFCSQAGNITPESFANLNSENLAAVVIPQPNFFGVLEEVDELTNHVHKLGALVIAVVNPTAMALLKEPGSWGEKGADIVCGDGQPLGIPLALGGPYFGFLCCKQEYLRQMPGRIIGRTHDKQGREGYTLTLQAREQHIRRAKATSNICTNQGLMVVAATIYLSLLGPEGLRKIAISCHNNAVQLRQMLSEIEGIEIVFNRPIFHEFVLRFNKPLTASLEKLQQHGLQSGVALQNYYPELANCLLVCVTETKTKEDLEHYVQLLRKILKPQL